MAGTSATASLLQQLCRAAAVVQSLVPDYRSVLPILVVTDHYSGRVLYHIDTIIIAIFTIVTVLHSFGARGAC